MKNKKKIILISFLVVSLTILVMGITFSLFSRARFGRKENSITSGNISLKYTEENRGIALTDAMPISDSEGKTQTDYFDFKIESKKGVDFQMPYTITARMTGTSSNIGNVIKLYLTDQNDNEIESPRIFNTLTQYVNNDINVSNHVEKVLYTGRIPANTTNYTKNFRLRMWIDENANFALDDNNSKTFSIQINIYGTGEIASDSDKQQSIQTGIKTLTINNINATPITGEDYDYEVKLAEGTTLANINIVPENPYSSVKIEELPSGIAYNDNNNQVVRLSQSTNKQVNVSDRYNYYRITVTPEVGNPKTSILRVKVLKTYNSISAVKQSFSTSEENNVLTCEYDSTNETFIDCDYYDSIEKVIKYKTNAYVEIEDDITVDESINITSGKNITLDLNGNDLISQYVDETDTTLNQEHGIFVINGTLTLNDTTGIGKAWTGTSMRPVEVHENGNLIINGGNYSGRQAVLLYGDNAHATLNDGTYTSKYNNVVAISDDEGCSNCSITINGGTYTSSNPNGVVTNSGNSTSQLITINNGTFTNTNTSAGSAVVNGSTGSIIINDGIYSTKGAPTAQNYGTGTMTINGGNFTDTKESSACVLNYSTGRLNITGGTIRGCYAVSNYSTGRTKITGGTITGTNGPGVINASTGVTSINGSSTKVTGSTTGAYNSAGGTINICGGTVKGTNYDINNSISSGKIYYKSTVVFTNGTGNPKKGSTGTIAVSTTITCQ